MELPSRASASNHRLDALKRAAYARDATDDDRDALAAYVRGDAGPISESGSDSEDDADAEALGAAPDADPGAPESNRRQFPAIAVVALVALVGGACIDGIIDTRLLGHVNDVAIWGATQASFRPDGTSLSFVCMGFREGDTGATACVPREEFLTFGMRLPPYEWGPRGDVALIDAQPTPTRP